MEAASELSAAAEDGPRSPQRRGGGGSGAISEGWMFEFEGSSEGIETVLDEGDDEELASEGEPDKHGG